MAKVKQSIQSKRLVEAAERRAKCMAWIKGVDVHHSVAEVAAQMGWTPELARQTLTSLADAGLIEAKGKGLGRGNKVSYGPLGGPVKPAQALVAVDEGSTPVALVPALPVASKRQGKLARANGHAQVMPDQGVELVIGGICATITRNPLTGRPRVQFDL